MDRKCAEWVQEKRCECIRKVSELNRRRKEILETIPRINRKCRLLNESVLRVKDRLRGAENALRELSALAGVEYKIDLPDFESEVTQLVRELYGERETLQRQVPEIDEEINRTNRETQKSVNARVSETIKEFTALEKSSVETETKQILDSGAQMEDECKRMKDQELFRLRSETNRLKEKLTEDYEREVKSCEEVIKDYSSSGKNDTPSVVADLRKRIDSLTEQYRRDTQEIRDHYVRDLNEIMSKYDTKTQRIHEEINSEINEALIRSRNKTDDFVRRVSNLSVFT